MKKLSNFYIRAMAKALMRGHYGTCIGSMAVFVALSMTLSTVQQGFVVKMLGQGLSQGFLLALLIGLLAVMLMAPAVVGARGVFCDIANQKPTKATNVFVWYGEGKRLGGAVGIMLLQSLIIFACVAVFGGAVLYFYYDKLLMLPIMLLSLDPATQLSAVGLAYQMLLLVAVPTYLIVVRFLPAPYLLAEDPQKGVLACMKESCRILKGFYWKYVGLQLLSLLQIIAYAILASMVATLFSGRDVMVASSNASIILMIVTYFSILPQLGIGTALFLNDARVRPSGESAESPQE